MFGVIRSGWDVGGGESGGKREWEAAGRSCCFYNTGTGDRGPQTVCGHVHTKLC